MLRTSLRASSLGHEDRLTVVGHLDELRTRLFVSLLALAVSFGFCFWQNHRLLHWLNSPLAGQTQSQVRDGHGPLGAVHTVAVSARDLGVQLRGVVNVLDARGTPPTVAASLARARAAVDHDIARLSAVPSSNQPVTLGIGEPVTTTVTVSLLFALILALPVLLGQAYGFLIPAFAPRHRRLARSLLAAVPALFLTGVAFGYYVVLPAAVHFLLNFNSDQFNVLVQASQYYKFAATTLLALGLVFEVPVAIIAVTSAGVVTSRQLRRGRRYAVGACVVVAALLPGDLTTMLLETVP
ncbi:MAG TPA: twin-arginine translocase subunit TatC, partial [Solirubrobacteraceae bacterium]